MKNLVFIFMIISLLACKTTKKEADLMVYNGTIYTLDSNFSTAEAMLIKNDRIIALGNSKDLQKQYSIQNKLDLNHKFVYPGFYDAHCHFYGYGMNLIKRVDLTGSKSFNEVLEKITKFSKLHPTNPWIEGRGWDQNDWEIKEFPTNKKLNELFPDKPVFLIRIDGHAALANSKALEIASIDKKTKIEGGKILQSNNKLSGILIDNAVDLIYKAIPEPSKEMKTKALLQAQDSCFKVGLTTVDDAGLDYSTILLIDSLQKSNKLLMQIYAMLSPTKQNFEHFVKKGIYKTSKLNVRSIKLYADGALGSRGALLLKPYSDDPHQAGLQLTKNQDFDSICQLAYEYNYQINTHAIGDSAVRWVLNYYSKYLETQNDKRWRVEHSQIVNENDFSKYHDYSVIPSIQPTHATSDMYWAEKRLGTERIKGAYAYQNLLHQNGWLANGSDFPIESINPLYGFYAAVSRQDLNKYPKNGFQMENALTRKQALKAMTIWAAKSNFEENEKGSIETGKQADFVILDKDLLTCDIYSIPNLKIKSTFIGGKQVYSK